MNPPTLFRVDMANLLKGISQVLLLLGFSSLAWQWFSFALLPREHFFCFAGPIYAPGLLSPNDVF